MEWNDRIKISDEEAQEKAEKKDKVEEKEQDGRSKNMKKQRMDVRDGDS